MKSRERNRQLKPPISLSRTSCTAPSGVMGRRRRRDGNHSPQKYNSIDNSVANEENGYPVPDSNKTVINVTKELSDAHKKNP
jgi:hypothetical protein